mgnify:FL=1
MESNGWQNRFPGRPSAHMAEICGYTAAGNLLRRGPYLVSRYDTVTGETIPISKRIGLLDRKLRVISENTDTEEQIELCPGCKKMAA